MIEDDTHKMGLSCGRHYTIVDHLNDKRETHILQPPANTVYMTDAPPPYPGINGTNGYRQITQIDFDFSYLLLF